MTINEARAAYERVIFDRLAEALQKEEYKIDNSLNRPDVHVDGIEFVFDKGLKMILLSGTLMWITPTTEQEMATLDGYIAKANEQSAERIKESIADHEKQIEALAEELARIQPAETAAREGDNPPSIR